MRIPRISISLTALIAAAALAAGCGGGGGDQQAETGGDRPESVERLRLSALPQFGYPSPFAWRRGPGWLITGMTFDTLLWEDSTGNPIPWLAAEWESSDDGLQWRFRLNEDARWQDGRPVTAQDVAFTVDYMTQGPGKGQGGFAARSLQVVEEAVAESERVVALRLRQPIATFVEDVAQSVYILPEHIWADVEDPARLRGPEATMGSGPYRLQSYDQTSGSILYEANREFYLGEPYVKRLEFVPAEDDLLALQRGQIDAGSPENEVGIPQEQLRAFEEDPRLASLSQSGSWNRALHFNLDAGFPYDEVSFRHAVAYAIDRPDLIERVLFGRGQPGSTGGLAPGHPFLVDGLPDYAPDVQRANRLLDELGMDDTDGDGIRELPDGEPFRQELLSSNRFTARTPELIAEYLRKVGIDVEVRVLDQAAADEVAAEGDFTMTLAGYGGLMSDPDVLRTRYSSRVESDSFAQAKGYENARFDRLAAQQLRTVDTDERRGLIEEMQRIAAEDLPLLSLYVPNNTLFYDREVFDAWYYTPGCSPCGGTRNKHMFVTGQETGLEGRE